MAETQTEFPVAEESSVTRIADHVWFLRKLRALFAHVELPDTRATAYPTPPPGEEASPEETQRKWRVQAFLMNAEIRYSFYLRLLREWVLKYKPDKSSNNNNSNDGDGWAEEWPLPPSDVAIMFYIHMLSPKRFQRDMAVEYPELWEANVSFPLARLRQHPRNDEASQHKWEVAFPEVPYELFEFGSDGETPCLSTRIRRALDVHGYKCGSATCVGLTGRNRSQIIPMAEWAAYRLAKRWPPHVLGLWDAPLRQTTFVERIPAETATTTTATALDVASVRAYQRRYLNFVGLIQTHPSTTFVPTLDIDLVWHTHQLSPAAYEAYCRSHVRSPVNHEDTIAAPGRSSALKDTKRLWALAYREIFLGPDSEGGLATVRAAVAKNVATLEARRAEKDSREVEIKRQTALQDKEQKLASELGRARSALDGVRARIRIGVGPIQLWQWYSPGRRVEQARRSATVKEVEEKLQAKREKIKEQATIATEARTESEVSAARYESALKLRKQLEAELETWTAKPKTAVVRECIDRADLLRGDPFGKGMLSVVPSAAQVMSLPIVGDWKSERRREWSKPIQSWGIYTSNYHQWSSRLDPEGGGSFGGLAFGPDRTGWGNSGIGSGGCGGGGGGGGGLGEGCGCGGGGCA
ncbi:hypothetical protein C7999DRAFT_30512 [Corynascus novoguineensis]|uniref:Uncharacterized protein n=1 Tax=Corynascus novoguineensis TaxID=1126955 RepID=A0AAN7CW48_9PEZI|nr:hypothetical protein C7999DRAFT_30512 [Corynascus novoguineensis]